MFVYVLYSHLFNRMYIGMSSDPQRRLKEHNRGQTFSTKGFRPWKLVHVESFPDRKRARERERLLKSGAGREWIRMNVLKNMAS